MNKIKDDLVSLKNGLPPSNLASAFHKNGVVFVHVPKCAGTSVENALRRTHRLSRHIISPSASFDAAERELGVTANDDTRHDVLNMASEIRRSNLQYALATGYNCITGHAPLTERTIEAWKDEYTFVTILRDPIKRFKSHLSFNYSEQSGHGRVEEDIDTFLERPRAKTMGALFVKYFSGLPMTADFQSRDAIERSKRTLEKIDVVGFTDDLPSFAAQVSEKSGKPVKIGHDNKTAIKPVELSEKQMEKVHALCAPDVEIFEWANKRFRG